MTQSPSTQIHHNVVPLEVGWQFVPQYYHFINKQPDRLHCFYTKTSTFIHGTEGEEGKPCYGQQEIHNRITAIGFQDCKVFIHSVDAQSSANGGIIIQAIGEMSNAGEPWRKFVQTFFLAEQPNGYFVLNDIFRFLKEETVEDDASEASATGPVHMPEPTPSSAPSMPVPEPAHEPEPERAPSPAPALPAEEPVVVPPSPSPSPQPEPAHTNGNGISAPEEQPAESSPAPTPARSPIPSPAPPPAVSLPVPATASPAPSTPAPSTPAASTNTIPPASSAPSSTTAPSSAPAPPQQSVPPQSSAPPIPRTPKTWANLAATNSKKWGATAADSRGISEAPVSSPSTPTNTQPPSGPYSGPNARGGPGPNGPQNRPNPNAGGRDNNNATANSNTGGNNANNNEFLSTITTPQCFVKGVTDNVSQPVLSTLLTTRFGSIKDLEIVRSRACAFLEFTSVDAARKAIGASMAGNGVRVDVEGGGQVRISIETKKERGDRPVGRGRGGPPGGDRGGYRGRGNVGGSGGGGGPRGRGGQGQGSQGQGPAPPGNK